MSNCIRNVFKIVQWNVRGLAARRADLDHLIFAQNPSCLLLSETLLNSKHSTSFKNFNVFRKDRPGQEGGGLVTLVAAGIPCREVSLPPSDRELLCVNIVLNSKSLNVLSGYDFDGKGDESTLDNVLGFLSHPMIIAGDFNRHCSAWGSTNSTERGRAFLDVLLDNDLSVTNDGLPTFRTISRNYFSHLDVTAMSPNLAASSSTTTLDFGTSDHAPILTSLHESFEIWHSDRAFWKVKDADWLKYSSTLTNLCDSINPNADIPALASTVHDAILKAASLAVPMGRHKVGSRVPPAWWNRECRLAIIERNRAKSKAIRHGSSGDFLEYKRLCAVATRIIKDAKRSSWITFVDSLSPSASMRLVWRRAKGLKMTFNPSYPTIRRFDSSLAVSAQDRAEALLEPFKPAPLPPVSVRLDSSFRDVPPSLDDAFDAPFSLPEFDAAILHLRSGCPGPDGILNDFLKHLPFSFRLLVLNLFNRCWNEGVIPDVWKVGDVRPILKPGKDPSSALNYRVIALTSCMLKLYEKLVVRRLVFFLENNHLLPDYQSGFRKSRSTLDTLMDLDFDVRTAAKSGCFTVAAFLDIKRAFDNVLHEAILARLRSFGVSGNLYAFCVSYLAGRIYRINVEGSVAQVTINRGVPQGGVMSPHLFSIVMSNIGSCLPPLVRPSLFADDYGVRSSSKSLDSAVSLINDSLEDTADYADLWGLEFDTAKCKVVIFHPFRKKAIDLSNVKITFQNNILDIVHEHKVLGVVFSENLSWSSHIRNLEIDCLKRLNLIRWVSHFRWGSDLRSLRTLFLTLIRSKIEYAGCLLASAPALLVRRLDLIQNQATRAILGLPKNAAVDTANLLSSLHPLAIRREAACVSYTLKRHSFDACVKDKINDVLLLNFGLHAPVYVRADWILSDPPISLPEAFNDILIGRRFETHPPWTSFQFQFFYDWLPLPKSHYAPSVLRSEFLSYIDTHFSGRTLIYSDGSKDRSQNRCGAGIFCSSPPLSLSHRLQGFLSITSAEITAISLALEWACTHGVIRNCVIVSDSMVALQQIESISISYPLISDIYDFYGCYPVCFVWCPSHCDILPNDRADALAKEALEQTSLSYCRFSRPDVVGICDLFLRATWEDVWNFSVSCPLAQEIFNADSDVSHLSTLSRIHLTVYARLVCNCAALKAYKFRIGLSPSPLCDSCGSEDTTKHYLLECSRFTVARSSLSSGLSDLGLPLSIANVLAGYPVNRNTKPKVLSLLFDFITSTVKVSGLLTYN